jgi:tetratricopeptide (TPR) repeat protein
MRRPVPGWKYVIQFCLALASILGFFWVTIQLIQWLFKREPLHGTGLLGTLVLVSIGALLASFFVIFNLFRDTYRSRYVSMHGGDQQLTDTIMDDLRRAYNQQNWEEVLKIGTVLSRPFWITGKYKLRVELGKLVEAAAAYQHNYYQQASALIDDLGWTRFVLGETDQARLHISHGISLAEKVGNAYLVYKGNRHLSGIALSLGSMTDAEHYHVKAKDAALQIAESAVKQEALAGLHVNEALLHIERKNWPTALEEIAIAEGMYEGLRDEDRIVKLYQFKGGVLFELGRIKEAKDVYRQGLTASKKESRKDGILMNNLGLARVALREGDEHEAKRAYSEAAAVCHELGRESLAKELEKHSMQLPLKPPEVRF